MAFVGLSANFDWDFFLDGRLKEVNSANSSPRAKSGLTHVISHLKAMLKRGASA